MESMALYSYNGRHNCLNCDDYTPGTFSGNGYIDVFECASCGDILNITAEEDAIMNSPMWDDPR